jgi:hypothetical protein
MKKFLIIISIIFFAIFLYTRKMEIESGFVAPGVTYVTSVCNGYFLSTGMRGSDGPQGGFCFGIITEKTITTKNPCGDNCNKNTVQDMRYAQ